MSEIDPATIKLIWPYLRPQRPIPSDEKLRKSVDLANDLLEELQRKAQENQAKMDKLLKDSPSCTSDKAGAFALREQTLNSL